MKIRRSHALFLAAGLLALAGALLSPLHHLGQRLFAAHMLQHEILMLVAAPLIIAGRPHVLLAWILPRALSRAAAALGRTRAWLAVSGAAGGWLIHAIVIWAWHHPALFQATLHGSAWHGLQHASFLASALLFWWSVAPWRPGAHRRGVGLASIFSTLMHTGLLGMLLTIAPRPWYPAYGDGALAFGLTPLEDQQIGGLIMWIPAGLIYVVAGLMLCWRWLRDADRRTRARESALVEAEQ